jgi:TetR/AcrR family transcriptional regulator, regulator of cefoperazone and chloramphenicol sensitivity
MKKQRKSGINTRERLLAAASDVFADKSYHDATIAEICEKAEANIAAVNYHFNDKETLYREAWRYAFEESIKAYPSDGGVRADAPPEERLRGQIIALLRRIADENNKEFFIAQKEFVSPTGLLDEVIREELEPMHDRTETLVRELLGSQIPDVDVQFCVISIINQCVNPIVTKRNNAINDGRADEGPPRINDIEAFADHVVLFSLAGLAAICTEREKT